MKKILLTLLILSCYTQANTWIRMAYFYPNDTKDRFGSDSATVADIAAKYSFSQTAFKRSGTQTRLAGLRVCRINNNITDATNTLDQLYDFMDDMRSTFVWPYHMNSGTVKWAWGKTALNYVENNNISLACFVSPLSTGAAYGQVYDRFSLVKYNNTGATYAHEAAHNFTVFHNTGGYVRNDEDADLNDTEFYASNLDNNKRTSMGSYNLQLRIARFSNPNRTYSGYPYGTADRNNAAIMRSTRTNVRSYRNSW